ncbi:SMI1/KNR4 family protein [Streptomyces bohaiensis]|uniref:SMI1/KNR4 family protein n=1 Tax=Streptomyces bohaiensis TaxID=1431344 RepID=UPI003B7EE4B1
MARDISSFPYLEALLAMLGEPRGHGEDAAAWARLETELGCELPADFKRVSELHAPVEINGHMSLHHPATQKWNLAERIAGVARAFGEVAWDWEFMAGDPRPALGTTELTFGGPGGLVPVLGTDRGERVFWAPRVVDRGGQVFCLWDDDEFYRHDMSLSEWLYRYLVGKDLFGPNSAAFYPGPVQLKSLPMSYEDTPVVWYGPERGM